MAEEIIQANGKDFEYLVKFSEENNVPVCIYGCGVNGEVIASFLDEHGVEIRAFVDKQAEVREFEVLNKTVVSPNTYIEKYSTYKIVVSPDNHEEIVNFLKESGIKDKDIIVPFKQINHTVIVGDNGFSGLADNYNMGIKKDTGSPVSTIFTIMFNTPEWMFRRTIESVLSQSYTNLSYLIIDNGSTDDSANVAKEYADKDSRINYIRLERNVPWGDANLLLTLKNNIRTKYVAMVDSDDYYEKDFLKKAIETAENDEADIVQVNTLTYGDRGFRYNYFAHYLGKDVCLDKEEKMSFFLKRIINVPVWGKLYRTELFNRLIDKMLACPSDYERDREYCLDTSWMSYLVVNANRVSLCDDILHIRTWRPGSSEHSDNHSSKWMTSILRSIRCVRETGIDPDRLAVFEEAQLIWLFGLLRDDIGISIFLPEDLEDFRVKEYLKRPVCDRYKGL